MDSAQLRSELARCHDEAFAWALHCCGRDRERAVEALQSSYLKVLDGHARFDGRSAFRTWLFAVIRRTAADEGRRGAWLRLRLFAIGTTPEPASPAPPADQLVENDERRARLLAALGQLPARQREVLVLVFYHDCTVEEAAEVMGIGVGSARTHYARGKEKLRQLLAGTVEVS